jgi:transposase
MGTSYRRYDPDQALLLPPSLRDWLPEEHLAYFISDTVDQLDLRAFYKVYEGDGRRNQPFEPAMMLKVLIYAYASGTFSSRKIARRLHEDVALRVLGAGNFPKHRTIADFRCRHLEDFEKVFVQVVRIATETGLVSLGTLAIDGSKVKANASKHKAMSYGYMLKEEKRLSKEIRDLTKRASKLDAKEDELYGAEYDGDQIPEELRRRKSRLAVIAQAKQRLEQRQAEEDRRWGREPGDDEPGDTTKRGPRYKRKFGEVPDKKQDNFTDPDSRIMKTSKGYEQCYNAQAAVDEKGQVIVAANVGNNASDAGALEPVLEAAESNTAEKYKRVLADSGYASESALEALEERGIDGYVAIGREGKDAKKTIADDKPATQRMAGKLATKRGKARYARRKGLAESPFGWIKSVMGFRQFSVRGLRKVAGEWQLVCAALNLKRMSTQMQWA